MAARQYVLHNSPFKGSRSRRGKWRQANKGCLYAVPAGIRVGYQRPKNPLRLDAVKPLPDGRIFGLEWETGNISSSHRAINRILLGHMHYDLIGGVLVVPSKNLYQYLTDRVGNYPELEPYFDVWSTYPLDEGILAIIVVEQDGTSSRVPRIKKGTDGRAMI